MRFWKLILLSNDIGRALTHILISFEIELYFDNLVADRYSFRPLIIFTKRPILDVWQGSEYTTAFCVL